MEFLDLGSCEELAGRSGLCRVIESHLVLWAVFEHSIFGQLKALRHMDLSGTLMAGKSHTSCCVHLCICNICTITIADLPWSQLKTKSASPISCQQRFPPAQSYSWRRDLTALRLTLTTDALSDNWCHGSAVVLTHTFTMSVAVF